MADQIESNLGDEPASAAVDEPTQVRPVIPEVSEQAWRALFEVAQQFREAAPWKRLYDADWFGLRDPEGDVTHVGSILGMGGQVKALHLYLHPEGVAFWNETIQRGKPDPQTLQFRNRLLEAEFVSKGRLGPQDWEVRERLLLPKLPNKGRPYVCFRSVVPGSVPWFLNEDEAGLLSLAMHAGLQHARVFPYDTRGDDYPMGEKMPLIPVFSLKAGADPRSGDAWNCLVEEMPEVAQPGPGAVSAETRERLDTMRVQQETTWELGGFPWSELTLDGGRPVFPWVTFVVDSPSAQIMGHGMELQRVPMAERVGAALAAAAEEKGNLPAVIAVQDPETLAAVVEVVGERGVEVRRRQSLPALSSVIEALGRDSG